MNHNLNYLFVYCTFVPAENSLNAIAAALNVACNAVTTSNNNNILTKNENRLPKPILDKAIKSGNEFGWTQADFLEVVETARQNFMAIIGGQIQYVLPDGTCELYWLSYDPDKRQLNEDWLTYCDRTAKECVDKFNKLILTTDLDKEGLTFGFLAGYSGAK